jgi:CRISPR-associated protein Cas1
MRLIIDDYGTYIHKKGNRFIISNPAHQKEFSADIVSQILVYKGAAVTSAAMELAVKNGIDIVFFEAKIRNQSFLLKILAKDRNNEQLKNRAEKLMSLIEKLECGRTIE